MSETFAGPAVSIDRFHSWWAEQDGQNKYEVRRIPFDEFDRWRVDPVTGDIRHDSGRFFTVEGLRVRSERGPVPEWSQPIINQPEIGILGILVKRFNGVPHCLMQCKMEPGNINILQLSPTVQATRSNYTKAHNGADVTYLEYFVKPRGGRVLVDVLQSEHGSWFLRKRNRNMVVEIDEEIPVAEGFCWLTLDQIGELLRVNNLVNMDSRTVLSCLPNGNAQAADDTQLRSWFTEICASHNVQTEAIPLAEVDGWHRSADEIRHDEGLHFKVVGVSVQATSREVAQWTQPMFQPCGIGVVAFVIRYVDGVLNVLAHARAEPGFVDVVEIGPTVQYQPSSYPNGEPPFADLIRRAPAERIHYDAILSEEGGRFYQAENRYVVVELDDGIPDDLPEDYRWLTLDQLSGLLAHRNYLNIQARTLVSVMRLTLGLH
ncbi:NDP-hexose 2,3-dehydratase family protein [Kibdelosporangium persicum]|uniref:Oxidase EvaA n=1 Tax=Kibdelosporangium persicum TaxID=2698649 RepID=A0ABX2F6X8_9PSEU|nr:NDP-hexose 2,3-dehydratase family protein [Kibdelosporangium persicum]NRN66568.1 Oxidase EvaA [Kibdelosporangium persicum]